MSNLDAIKTRAKKRRQETKRFQGPIDEWLKEAEADLDLAIAIDEATCPYSYVDHVSNDDEGTMFCELADQRLAQVHKVHADNTLMAQHNADLMRELEKAYSIILKFRNAILTGNVDENLAVLAETESYEAYR